MAHEIVPVTPRKLARIGLDALPALIADAGEQASRRFLEFFTTNIRNKNTRLAFARAVPESVLARANVRTSTVAQSPLRIRTTPKRSKTISSAFADIRSWVELL